MGKRPEGIWNKEAVISILFPRRCPVCGEIAEPKGEKICPECRKKLSFVSGPCCLKCGKELAGYGVLSGMPEREEKLRIRRGSFKL